MRSGLADIVCFEMGSGGASAWTGSRCELVNDIAALEIHALQGLIQIDTRGDHVEICGAKKVGLAILPSGRRLMVRSKVPSLKLLEWLAYVGVFPALTQWLPEAAIGASDDCPECIARLFLLALEHVTRLHLRKDYVSVEADEYAIRGRVLTTDLARRFHRLPRVPQSQRRRTFNTPFNIVLALALDRVPQLLVELQEDDIQRLAHLGERWASIDRNIDDAATAVTTAQCACPHGYREAIQLARLILLGADLDPISNMGGQAFSISLAGLWERALRRMIDQLANQTGWRRVSKNRHTRRWDDSVGWADQKRWLQADVIVEHSKSLWVLDAKYKCEFGDEGRVDRFQMCAYAAAFDADRVSLVYPTVAGSNGHRKLLETNLRGRPLLIDSIALPMADGPAACVAALATILSATQLLFLPRDCG